MCFPEIQSLFSVPKNRWADYREEQSEGPCGVTAPARAPAAPSLFITTGSAQLNFISISACLRDLSGHASSPGGLHSPARQHALPLSLQTTMLGAERAGESPAGLRQKPQPQKVQKGSGWRAAPSPVMDQLWEISGKGWKGETGAGISMQWERATPENSPGDNAQHPGHTDAP